MSRPSRFSVMSDMNERRSPPAWRVSSIWVAMDAAALHLERAQVALIRTHLDYPLVITAGGAGCTGRIAPCARPVLPYRSSLPEDRGENR